MKRFLVFLIALSVLLALGACREESDEGYVFYYLHNGDVTIRPPADSSLVPEIRDTASTNPEIAYLLRLYLEGPVTENLVSPFPDGTILISVSQEGSTLSMVLSEEYSTLSDIHLTLAGACLSSTCFALSDAEEVAVESGEKTYIYTRDSFTLTDDSASGA